ncbi:hypothetical protein LJK88_36145 [Paenibacillus sp. P26]|nr:hypothetical protein LJK88_36145 [Paenibacillus sp. P26]UUZ93575.1 hypothetical protein LJK87_02105 [Paenibacillus sp. P25]
MPKKWINVILFFEVIAVIIFIGSQSESISTAKNNPNPMKVNTEQFSRIQQAGECFASK